MSRIWYPDSEYPSECQEGCYLNGAIRLALTGDGRFVLILSYSAAVNVHGTHVPVLQHVAIQTIIRGRAVTHQLFSLDCQLSVARYLLSPLGLSNSRVIRTLFLIEGLNLYSLIVSARAVC